LYSLAYSEFVVPLVKAVQEQQAMIENQKNQLEVIIENQKNQLEVIIENQKNQLEVQQQQIDLLMRRIEALENKK
jgi:polyhydroxyalkanoate synthesis regulator phasin